MDKAVNLVNFGLNQKKKVNGGGYRAPCYYFDSFTMRMYFYASRFLKPQYPRASSLQG